MKAIQDYEILEKIDETTGSFVYRGRKSGNIETVVLKVLKAQLPSPSEIARFKQEYDIIKNLDSDDIIKTLDILYHDNGIVIVLEDFNGVSIEIILESGKVFDIKTFLNFGIKITNALGVIHNKGIIHKDIKPGNILVNQDDGRIKITDFGISSVITHENEQIYKPDVMQGSLLYMSPEQTGRMNHIVDYRTDIYSLGVTFYKMLSGCAPFESKDPLEIIHSHIAKEPVPLYELKPDIPKVISDIILKLMSKNAEERYQSCFGLAADLQTCLDTLDPGGEIKQFELAKHDISGKFMIPQKLFGRNKEIDILLSSLDEICSSGQSDNAGSSMEIILITGNPGIGKSALISEINRTVAERNGYLLSGKFEQFRGAAPFSAIIQAFQKLLQQIASGNQDQINEIRSDILDVLGQNGKIITDIIPELELIIGKQPDVVKLGPNEVKNRFNIVFVKFLSVFAKKEHPIVLLLDNLQWADIASIQLIINIINSEIKHLLLIGSYRGNEISESHPLTELLKHISESGIRIQKIVLTELKKGDTKDLILNFLKCNVERGTELAEIVFKKTGGNPFFVNGFLHTLYNEKELEFDPYTGWKWDAERISKMNITENVVEFLSDKINRLPARVQEVLKICACIGNRFDLESLSLLLVKSIEETLVLLSEAMDEGYISNLGRMYIFNHDRIQEAAYSMLSDKDKKSLHYRIGRLMQEKTDIKELNNKLLYITDQLNLGSSMVTDPNELENLAHLNYNCGIKSKASTAFFPAFKYFQKGIDILGKSAWEKHYDLILALYSEATEAAYLNGDYDEMDGHAATVIEKARNIYNAIPVYESKILTYDALGHYVSSINTCLDVLDKLNCPLPRNPGRSQVKIALLIIRPYLYFKGIESLIDLPDVTDQHMIVVFKIFSYLTRSALNVNPDLCFYAIIVLMKLSFKYGKCDTQSLAYIRMANILINVIGDIDTGYRLGNIGLQLVKKFNLRNYEASAYSHYYLFIAIWKEHLKSVRSELMKGYLIGMETGDIQSASLSLIVHDGMLVNTAVELSQAEQQMARDYSILIKLKQEPLLAIFCIFWQFQLILLGKTDSYTELTGSVLNKEQMNAEWKKNFALMPLSTFHVTQLILKYIFNEYHKAMDDSDAAVKYLGSTTGGLAVFDYYFYSSLTMLACYPEQTKKKKREYLRKVNRNLKKIKGWAIHAPMNNEHRVQIVEAEELRISGKNNQAEAAYDRAIELSRKNEFLIEEAISNELAGNFYLSISRHKVARIYIQDAYACYSRWGAVAKLKQMQERYSEIISKINISYVPSPDTADSGSAGFASNIIDIKTILKASQTISGEVVLEKLLIKMIKIAMENAGAQKGFMILENNGRYLIEAESTVEKNEIRVLDSIPVENHEGISSLIINYTARTKEIVILNDASAEGNFINDPYILRNKPKSILCAPIINQGNLIGMVYLENNLSSGAFTQERVEILNILSSQMAIAIETANFYKKLEDTVLIRTKELKSSEKRFKDIAYSIADWIWEVDKNGHYTYCSERVEECLGYRPEELIGRTGYDTMPPDEIIKIKEYIEQKINEGVEIKDVESWHLTKDGRKKCFLTNSTLIYDDDGNIGGYRGVDKDITERKQNELKLQEIMQELSRSNKELEQFAYMVSHDLQEPLRKIMTFGDRVKETNDNDKKIDYIGRMQNAAKRMQGLILGLLDYSRVTTKVQPFVVVELNKIISDVLSDMEIRIRESGGNVEVDKLPVVMADPLQMRQLFQNLIGNALKFRRKEVLSLIKIYSVENNNGKLCTIVVEDNGIGIDEPDYDKIFGVFQRLHGKSDYEGYGIGLAICKKIVERHGGKINVEGKINEGTKFILKLPVK